MNATAALPAAESAPASTSRSHRPIIPLSDLIAANRQRDALYELSEQLLRASTPQAIYDAALDAIESALECDRASILLFDENDTMQFVAWHGISDAYRTAVTGHTPWKKGELDAVPIPVPDIAAADLEDGLRAVVLGEGIRAAAFIPLVSEGRVIGKFMAYFREPHAFTQEDLAVSLIIARQLAFSIERLEAEENLRDKQRELAEELAATQMLQSLSVEMAHAADIEALYEKIMDAAVVIMRSDFASMQQLYPHRGKTGELRLLAHRGFNPEAAKFWMWVNADSACTCGAAFRSKARAIWPDIEAAPGLQGTKDLETFRRAGIRSAQSTPLMSRRGVMVGMLSTHWSQPHTPSERDVRLLDILSRLAANLIERITDDEELRTREERARTLIHLLSDVPWQARSDGAFEELQPAWENYTGQSWDQHAGHGWFEAIHPDDRDAARTTWATACFHAQPYEIQARVWHAPSESYRHCLIRATPIRHEDGSVREWVGACTDVRAGPGPN
jgi:PAS domain S-box-containing protein